MPDSKAIRSSRWVRLVASTLVILVIVTAIGAAPARSFSIAVTLAPSTHSTAIVAASAAADLASFGSVRLRGRGDVAFTGGSAFGAALLASVQEKGVDLYGGAGIGFGAVATSGSRETFIAPYFLFGVRMPLAFDVGLVLEARATPRLGAFTFAFGLDLGFGP